MVERAYFAVKGAFWKVLVLYKENFVMVLAVSK